MEGKDILDSRHATIVISNKVNRKYLNKTERFHKSYSQGGQSQVQAKPSHELSQQRMKIALPIPNPRPLCYAESFLNDFFSSSLYPSSLLLESRQSSLRTSSHSFFFFSSSHFEVT